MYMSQLLYRGQRIDTFRIWFFPSMWNPGIKLQVSGMRSKCFYSLSHVSSPAPTLAWLVSKPLRPSVWALTPRAPLRWAANSGSCVLGLC